MSSQITIEGLDFNQEDAALTIYRSPSGQTTLAFLSLGRIPAEILDHYGKLPDQSTPLNVQTKGFNGLANWTISERL